MILRYYLQTYFYLSNHTLPFTNVQLSKTSPANYVLAHNAIQLHCAQFIEIRRYIYFESIDFNCTNFRAIFCTIAKFRNARSPNEDFFLLQCMKQNYTRSLRLDDFS